VTTTNSVSETPPVKILPDPMLDETERILENYISLWPSEQKMIANH
jgi:hypothetical protein